MTRIEEDRTILSVLHGTQPLHSCLLSDPGEIRCVTADSTEIPFTSDGMQVHFDSVIPIHGQLIIR